jgi:hypothetical protein
LQREHREGNSLKTKSRRLSCAFLVAFPFLPMAQPLLPSQALPIAQSVAIRKGVNEMRKLVIALTLVLGYQMLSSIVSLSAPMSFAQEEPKPEKPPEKPPKPDAD